MQKQMVRVIHWIGLYLGIVGVLGIAPVRLSAFSMNAPNSPCTWAAFEVDAVYLTPGDSQIVAGSFVEQTIVANLTDSFVQPITPAVDYNWGVRAQGRKYFRNGCLYVSGGYMYYDGQGRERAEITAIGQQIRAGTSAFTVVGSFLDARTKFRLQTAEGLGGYYFHSGPCFWASVYGGGSWVTMTDRIDAFGQQISSPTVRLEVDALEQASFRGGGPMVGLDATYRPWHWLDLSANVFLAAYIGRRKGIERDESRTVTTVTAIVRNSDLEIDRTLVDAFGFDLGVAIGGRMGRVNVKAKAGYLLRRYGQVLSSESGEDSPFFFFFGLTSASTTSDLKLGGPYVGLVLEM